MLSYTLLELQCSADPHLARTLHNAPGLSVWRASSNKAESGVDAVQSALKSTAGFELSSGGVFLRLPYPNLCSLADLLDRASDLHAYALLLHVSTSTLLLPASIGFAVDAQSVFLTEDAPLESDVVFFPAGDASRIRQLQLSSARGNDSSAGTNIDLNFAPPKLTGSAITAFGLAALWHSRLSSQPFCLNPEAEPSTPRLYARFSESFPAMPAKLQQAFDACIQGRRPARPAELPTDEDAHRLIGELLEAMPGSATELSQAVNPQRIDTAELHRRQLSAAKSRRQRVRRFERREFLRRRGARVALMAVLVLFFGGIVGTSINRALQPPITHGLAPEEVVRLHYTAVNELDPELLGATLARGVARQRVDELTTLYVTSRARMSVEMETGHYPADDWIKEGRPELAPTVYPYGTSTPEIRELNSDETSALYEARFIRVDFEFEDSARNSQQREVAIREYHVREELQLSLRNGVWRIVALDAQLEEPIGESH